jgi:Dihydrodipicolinate synthase/N-acetylneuraminate lyase
MSKFTGTGVALITPFNADLSIDFDALEAIIEHNITNGTNYLVLCGTTGESVTITPKENNNLYIL